MVRTKPAGCFLKSSARSECFFSHSGENRKNFFYLNFCFLNSGQSYSPWSQIVKSVFRFQYVRTEISVSNSWNHFFSVPKVLKNEKGTEKKSVAQMGNNELNSEEFFSILKILKNEKRTEKNLKNISSKNCYYNNSSIYSNCYIN